MMFGRNFILAMSGLAMLSSGPRALAQNSIPVQNVPAVQQQRQQQQPLTVPQTPRSASKEALKARMIEIVMLEDKISELRLEINNLTLKGDKMRGADMRDYVIEMGSTGVAIGSALKTVYQIIRTHHLHFTKTFIGSATAALAFTLLHNHDRRAVILTIDQRTRIKRELDADLLQLAELRVAYDQLLQMN